MAEEKVDDEGYIEIKADDSDDSSEKTDSEETEEEPKEMPKVKTINKVIKKHTVVHTEKKHEKKHEEKHAAHYKKHKGTGFMAVVLAIIVLVLLWNVYTLYGTQKDLSGKVSQYTVEKIPAKIQITKITDASCKNCYSLTTVLSAIKANNVEVTKEDEVSYNSTAGKALIAKYGIDKIPALVVAGDVARTQKLTDSLKLLMENKAGDYVFTQAKAPYTKLDGTVVGLVSATLIKEASCTQCGDSTALVASLKQMGIAIKDQEELWASSIKGQGLIQKYNISILPAVILSSDIDSYDTSIKSQLVTIFSTEGDSAMVQRIAPPPYYDVATGMVKGLIDLTLVTDNSCAECYNVSIHEQILTNPAGYNVKISSKKVVDISDKDGKAIVKKYNLTKVPTFIMVGDVAAYASLANIWSQVGSEEADGSFVFRNVEVMNVVYKNLQTGEVTTPAAAPATG